MSIVGFASQQPVSKRELSHAPSLRPGASKLLEQPRIKGAVRANTALASLGIHTVNDLFAYLPIDEREQVSIQSLLIGQSATIVVQVQTIRSRPVRRRGMKPLVEAQVSDETGTVTIVFFNQPWLVSRYQPGTVLLLHGTYRKRNQFAVSTHAVIDRDAPAEDEHAASHYRATAGITSTQLLALVRENLPLAHGAVEPLPAYIRLAEALPDLPSAILAGHQAQREAARKRLAFDELLSSQLALLQARSLRCHTTTTFALNGDPSVTKPWLAQELPFALTNDQKEAIAAIGHDLGNTHPMQRLLMGDVGSGKTVVALYALLRALEHGMQGALMAPTETLAQQHHATLQRLLGKRLVSIGLLTGSTPAKRRRTLLAQLASGELSLVVGTHALIEEAVQFAQLAVVVIDEQHRFGVEQRAAFHSKKQELLGGEGKPLLPHILHMTATPIPRTLALTLYGDLDVTMLRELPAGRKPITTIVVDGEEERATAFVSLTEQLREGRQGFVIYPLVEESGALEVRAATAELERLQKNELSGFRLGLLHGRLRPQEKSETMASFVAGELDVLVSTTVIEVGIDVPNATVMIVENAERFGIAQLHQLRGRVGRGGHASQCFLLGSHRSARLRALQQYHDGFRLAEIDLKLRGEGELVGTKQSGQARFQHAMLPEDIALLERARHWAGEIIQRDPQLKEPVHVLLAERLSENSVDGVTGTIPA